MAKQVNRLTTQRIGALKTGRHHDGAGLYLLVRDTGAKFWIFVYQWEGKRKEKGLGSLTKVDLKEARKRAADARRLLDEGVNPIEAKTESVPQGSRRFEDVGERYVAWKEDAWKRPKYAADWRRMLKTHLKALADKDVGAITAEDLAGVFRPIWTTMASAKEMRARVRQILDASEAWGLRELPNPDRRLDHLLPKRNHMKVHRKAMPYEDVPRLMRQLSEKDSVSALALRFTILTAVRSTETLGARKAEFDLRENVWVIPAERMKAGLEHRVPLSAAALAIVEEAAKLTSGENDAYLFPGRLLNGGRAGDRPMAHPSLWNLLKQMADEDLTVHGFRSSFADWAADQTDFPYEVVEKALAHAVGSAVSRAYRRTDSLDKRRELMAAWADYVGRSTCVGRPAE